MARDRRLSLDFSYKVYALPDGKPVTFEEAEALLLAELEHGGPASKEALWNLAVLYGNARRHADSLACIERLHDLAEDREERARYVLATGRHHEQVDDYESAIVCYRTALGLTPEDAGTSYWIRNNLGHSLVQLGRYEEAEVYLRDAVDIDPRRPNAFKNLGLSLSGQGQHARAADYFVLATQANASDGRSLAHLESLVVEHPELLVSCPDLPEKLAACRMAVSKAASAQPDVEAHLARLSEKKMRN